MAQIRHTLYAFVTLMKILCIFDVMEWDLKYKDLIKRIVCNTESNECIIHRCESYPGTATLKEFLDQELSEHEGDEKFNYCQWETNYRAILTSFTYNCEE